jgi:hypothetical protein
MEADLPNLLIPLLVFAGTVIMLEKNEEKYKGYRILRALPVFSGTVVFARYLFLVILTFIGIACNTLLAVLKMNTVAYTSVSLGQCFFITSLTLLFLLILYPCIFKKGYRRMAVWIWPPYIILVFMGSFSTLDPLWRLFSIKPASFYNPYLWGILTAIICLILFLSIPIATRSLLKRVENSL